MGRACTIGLILLLTGVAGGQGGGVGQGATAAFQAGSAAFAKGDLAGARVEFERAVRLAPRVSVAHGALGAVLLAEGYAAGAVKELERAEGLGAADGATLLNLAVARAEVRDYRGAVGALKRAGDAGVGEAEAVPLATALSETGDVGGAEALLRRALRAPGKSNAGDGRLEDALGVILAREGRLAEAEEVLRGVLRTQDGLATGHFHLGQVLRALRRPAEATVEMERACALEPANAEYRLGLAEVYVEAGREEEEIRVLRAGVGAAGVAAAVEMRYRLALALQATDKVEEARGLLDGVVRERPGDADVLTNAGLAHVQTGDAAGAVALYLRAMKVRPANETLREDLGVAYLQQSDLTGAIREFRAGLALHGANPQLHYDLGLALKLKDDLAGAIPEFERAAALDPGLPDPPYTLGVIYMQQGRFAEAAASLERAVALRPGNGDAWAELGSVYKQLGDAAKAEGALRQAMVVAPEQPSPHMTLAAVLAAEGRREEAAAERKVGADLTRVAVAKQKAAFGMQSGEALLKQGKAAEAVEQFESAVEAEPGSAKAHLGLAGALERTGRRAEAAQERRKAAELRP